MIIKCIFCGKNQSSIQNFKYHSEFCRYHPAVKNLYALQCKHSDLGIKAAQQHSKILAVFNWLVDCATEGKTASMSYLIKECARILGAKT